MKSNTLHFNDVNFSALYCYPLATRNVTSSLSIRSIWRRTLFPILLKKCPNVLELIDKLEGQHVEGTGRIRLLTEALNAFSASPDNVRDRLMDAASAFVAF